MTKNVAVTVLVAKHGWDYVGAEAIVDGLFEGITVPELLKVSEDYRDR
jgi:hypothetical protein